MIHDDLTRRQVYVAADRVSRPHVISADCPFCPGGLESRGIDGPYAFANRWPPVERDRCEVIVHGGDHERGFARMTVAEVRAVIDLWAQRSTVMQGFSVSRVRCGWPRPADRGGRGIGCDGTGGLTRAVLPAADLAASCPGSVRTGRDKPRRTGADADP